MSDILYFFILIPVFLLSTSRCDGNGDSRSGFNNPLAMRILNGDLSEPNSRPFQVALYKRVGTTGELGFCGGALLNTEWVITAAHCCFHGDQQVDNVQAILGAHSLYDRYENGRRIVNVAEVVVHPEWDPLIFANDLALLKLANVVQLTDTINAVRVPYLNISTFNFAGMGATMTGWGIPASGVPFVSPTLREKRMTVTTDTLCQSFYSQQLPLNIICGVDNAAGAGTCKGDNGGPYTIFYNQTEETILVGVASFVGIEGCTIDRPSVFTRVQRHLDWIADTTGIQLI